MNFKEVVVDRLIMTTLKINALTVCMSARGKYEWAPLGLQNIDANQ